MKMNEKLVQYKKYTHVVVEVKGLKGITLEGFTFLDDRLEDGAGKPICLVMLNLPKIGDDTLSKLSLEAFVSPEKVVRIVSAEYDAESELMEHFFSIHPIKQA